MDHHIFGIFGEDDVVKYLSANNRLENYITQVDHDNKYILWRFDDKASIWKQADPDWFNILVKDCIAKLFANLFEEFSQIDSLSEIDLFRLDNLRSLRERCLLMSSFFRIRQLLYEDLHDVRLFDQKKDKLPILQGKLIDLKSGEVSNMNKDDRFSYACNVKYNPDADPSIIMDFVGKLTCYDNIMLSNLQKILGYCITGDYWLIKGFYFVGNGLNGISTLMELMFEILGSGCMKLPPPPHLYIKSRINSAHRLIICESHDEDYKIELDKVKQIVICNNEPEILLPESICFTFKAKFVSAPKNNNEFLIDTNIMKTLKQDNNKSAFLNWLIEGAQKYYTGGF